MLHPKLQYGVHQELVATVLLLDLARTLCWDCIKPQIQLHALPRLASDVSHPDLTTISLLCCWLRICLPVQAAPASGSVLSTVQCHRLVRHPLEQQRHSIAKACTVG